MTAQENMARRINQEGLLWLKHIDDIYRNIRRHWALNRVPIFHETELWLNICIFLNWLAHFDKGEPNYVKSRAMVEWLAKNMNWGLIESECFWFCARNPLAHGGAQNPFSDYMRTSMYKKGLKLSAGLDYNLDPKEEEFNKGCWLLNDPFDKNKVQTSFFYKSIRKRLPAVLNYVCENIAKANSEKYKKIQEVNKTMIIPRVA